MSIGNFLLSCILCHEIAYIDKISENMIKSLSDALDSRELIKLTLLQNSEDDVREVAEELANGLNAEVVCTIGRKIVLYRYSNKKGVEHVKY